MALFDPLFDQRLFLGSQLTFTMRFDVAIFDINRSDLFHIDAALSVFGINPKHRGTVFADAEIIIRKVRGHRTPYCKAAQKVWMRVQASRRISSDVA